MLLVRFMVNSRLLVVKSLESQKSHMDFQLGRGSVPLPPRCALRHITPVPAVLPSQNTLPSLVYLANSDSSFQTQLTHTCIAPDF